MGKKIIDITPAPAVSVNKKRVAAYARVSCDKDAMLHSLAAQIDYYHSFICNNVDWEFVGVYADEAKTGTSEIREQFQLMLADCKAGKIDMVVTKSVSRFARNTVTLLRAVRMLKSLGIGLLCALGGALGLNNGAFPGSTANRVLANEPRTYGVSATIRF